VLEKIDKEIVNQYMIQPMKCMLVTEDFIKSTRKDLKTEVIDRICDGELELEERNSRQDK
jgi:hypothetical protein